MIVDLDRFKQVNDSLGHGVGDTPAAGDRRASRAAGVRRPTRSVARIGGDEFAVIVTGPDDTVVPTPSPPACGERRSVSRSSCSGLLARRRRQRRHRRRPRGRDDVEALLRAPTPPCTSRSARAQGSSYYSEDRDETGARPVVPARRAARRRRRRVARPALPAGLRRWSTRVDPERGGAGPLAAHRRAGCSAPADFLPVAVEAGIGRQLTDEVLRMASEQAAALARAAGYRVPVAVNLFEADLTDPELVDPGGRGLRRRRRCPRSCSSSR